MAENSNSQKKSSLYIVLGILTVIVLFVISAVVNAWTSSSRASSVAGSSWKSGKMFSSSSAGAIAILDVSGVIITSTETLEAIKEIEDDSSIKGIVIRINSPGGAVAPTQEIVGALHRLSKTRKIYCSLADIAASGGYYIATACEKIYTNPGTLTGSIGVIMPLVNLQELYKFVKVEPQIIKAGRFKDIGSQSRPMTPDERILMQTMADEIHRQFRATVKESRKLSDETIAEYADGRIFLGSQAIDYGFADKIGGEYDALEALASVLKVKVPHDVVRFPEPEPEYRSLLGLASSMIKPKAQMSESSEIIKWISSKAPELNPMLSSGVPYFLPLTFFSQSSNGSSSYGASK